MKDFSTLKVDSKVRALMQIVENDIDPRPSAGPCEPGFVHAIPGSLGEVVAIDEGNIYRETNEPLPTVHFYDTNTATIVFPEEIEVVEDE